MRQKRLAVFLTIIVAWLLLLAVGAVVLAQTSAGFNLEWHVIGSGGGESGSADYQVQGTIGQTAAGPPMAGSADFRVGSGYWFGDTRSAQATLYLPVIRR